ncbi:hypothetical protein B0A55_02630 [Friedmanniomyces simplex]|uniref:Uncharacterized protein n=1 Tax=Friedmanniomyces simplex TaxID=329884 RepID=A0A4U0XYW4_9PEZI|nr:hypothetical protein B0A55_02630 [Friedmanniomyces simplex]
MKRESPMPQGKTSFRQRREVDRVMENVDKQIKAYRTKSFDNYINAGIRINLKPTLTACHLVSRKGRYLGFDEYLVDIWGEEEYAVSVCISRNGLVQFRHLDKWLNVSEYLRHLKVKIDPQYTDGTPQIRSELQAQWWAANGKTFPLLQLPRELRDVIYANAFGPKIEPYPTSRVRKGAIAKPQRGAALMRVSKQVLAEVRSLLERQTPFLIEHKRIMALLLASPSRRTHIRRLELALSHNEFLKLFGFKIPDEKVCCTLRPAEALREMRLKHLKLRIAPPSLITGSAVLDGACQRIATRWILAAAWPYVRGHPVEVAGYVKRQQKADFEALCLDAKKQCEQWYGLRVAIGDTEGSLAEYDEWVEWVDGEEDGGVRVAEGPSNDVRHLIPNNQVGELPPRCMCDKPCTAGGWTDED